MYQLSKAGNWYVFQMNDRRKVYDLRELVIAMSHLGFELSHIEDGVVALDVHEDKVAHYGVNKTFMYST